MSDRTAADILWDEDASPCLLNPETLLSEKNGQ